MGRPLLSHSGSITAGGKMNQKGRGLGRSLVLSSLLSKREEVGLVAGYFIRECRLILLSDDFICALMKHE